MTRNYNPLNLEEQRTLRERMIAEKERLSSRTPAQLLLFAKTVVGRKVSAHYVNKARKAAGLAVVRPVALGYVEGQAAIIRLKQDLARLEGRVADLERARAKRKSRPATPRKINLDLVNSEAHAHAFLMVLEQHGGSMTYTKASNEVNKRGFGIPKISWAEGKLILERLVSLGSVSARPTPNGRGVHYSVSNELASVIK